MLNFKLGETNAKMKWSACHEHGTHRIQTPQDSNPQDSSPTGFKPMTSQTLGERSIHLSDGELMESEAIYWVHIIWHASCILLGSAMSMTQCVVKEWKMVNFKLSETNVKMKCSACHEHGTKKISESPTGFELWPPKHRFLQTDCVSQQLANCLYRKLSGWLAEMYNLLTQLLTDINWLSDCSNGSGTLKLIGIFAIMNDYVV